MKTKIVLLLVLVLIWFNGSGQNNVLKLSFIDYYTGYSIVPEFVKISSEDEKFCDTIYHHEIAQDGTVSKQLLKSGLYYITINTKEYDPVTTYYYLDNNTISVNIYFTPINPLKELSFAYINSLHRQDAMVIIGFVVDDLGKPLNNTKVYTSDIISQTVTNSRGFFLLIVPLANNENEVEARGTLLFEKKNYVKELRKNFNMMGNGDITLKIRMKKGTGINKVDIIQNSNHTER